VFTVLGIDRASNVFDRVGDSMDRMSKTGTKSMAAMLGASVAASAGIAAALAGTSIVFAGVAAAALSQNAEVAESFRSLGQSMKTGLVADAGVLEDEMVGAATEISAAFQGLRPQMRAAFEAAGPHIDSLVDGVTGFAREAMPGMVTAVQSAGPVMEGLEGLLISSGRATSDFLEVVAGGAPEAGFALKSMGDLAEGVLPNVGEMLVNLTTLWADNGDQAVRVISNITSVVSDLSSSALPTLSDGFGVALDVLEGLLAVIQPMSGALGPLIGMWLSLSLAMRGLSAVRGIVDNVGASISSMREKFSQGPGDVGKFSKAVGGVMNLLGGPWGLAVAGATALLAVFGQESEENAADQRTLAGALRESGGAFDENARKVLVESEAYQEVAGAIDAAGISQRDYLDAVIKGGSSLTDMEKQLRGIIDAGTETTNTNRGTVTTWTDQALAAKEALAGLSSMRTVVVGAIEDFRRQQEAIAGVASSMAGAAPGADSLAEAIGVLGNKTADTADRADALNTAWKRLMGVHLTMEEATSNFEGGLDDLAAHLKKVKEDTDNWRGALLDADGQVNLSTAEGRQLSGLLREQGEDYRSLAQAAYDSALQRGESEGQATLAAVAATKERRAQFITEAQQMGFNAAQAEALANRYLGLPNDVLTLIMADASNAQATIDNYVARNNGRVVTIFTRAVMTGAANAISAIGQVAGVVSGARAEGGPVEAGQIYKVGEQGEELFMAPADGQIVPNGPTRRFLSGLRAGAADRARSGVGGFNAEAAGGMSGGRHAAASMGGDDDRIVRLFTQALERVTVNLDGRMVGILQGRQAGLLGRTG
jgi:phage-related protein